MAGKKRLKVLMFSSPAFCRGGDWGLSSQHCSGIPGGRTRPERKGLSHGGGVRGQPAQGLWFILPVGFACCDPGENVLEIVSDAARSHTKRASPTLGWDVVEEPGVRQPAWKCSVFCLLWDVQGCFSHPPQARHLCTRAQLSLLLAAGAGSQPGRWYGFGSGHFREGCARPLLQLAWWAQSLGSTVLSCTHKNAQISFKIRRKEKLLG